VNLFGLLPLLFVIRLDQRVHNNTSVAVGDGNGKNFIVRIDTCKLQIKEQHTVTLHMVVLGTMQISLGSANGKILGKAILAKLAAITHILATMHAHQWAPNGSFFIVKIDNALVTAKRVSNRLLNNVIIHL